MKTLLLKSKFTLLVLSFLTFASCSSNDDSPIVQVIITGVTVTSDMGECCGGTLNAMLDGSGLTSISELGVHNISDADAWKSDFTLSGYLLFDFQSVYNLTRFAVWNNGQVGGNRGVNMLSIETSIDNVTFTPLPESPTQLTKAIVDPVAAENFLLNSSIMARYVRFNITSGHGAVNLGLGEVMFWAAN